jgi:hypothetical protein
MPTFSYGKSTGNKQQTGPKWAKMLLWRRSDPSVKWETVYELSEAIQAGLTKSEGGWDKNPGDMLIARVTTRGVRRYAPEVLNKTYLSEELGFYEAADGQEGTRLVAMEVDDEADAAEYSMANADDQPAVALPVAPPKPAPKPRAAAKPKVAPAPEPEPDAEEIPDIDFEAESDTPGRVAPLTEDEPSGTSSLDLAADDDVAAFDPDAEIPAREGVPQNEMIYDADGNPGNEFTRLHDLGEIADPEAEPEDAAAAAPDAAPEISAEDEKNFVNTGALRGYLTALGMNSAQQVELKAQCGYGEKAWPMLGPDERVVMYMAARDGMAG